MNIKIDAKRQLQKTDANSNGWNSIAHKWKAAGWPRRPRWGGEFENIKSMLEANKGKKAAIFGATPEFRYWLHRYDYDITLFEKSEISYSAMTSILYSEFNCIPKKESMIPMDWNKMEQYTNTFDLMLGDIFTGYLKTKENMQIFFENASKMLTKNGLMFIRDFVNKPYTSGNYKNLNIDERRWAYILTPGMAIYEDTYDEAVLAQNTKKIDLEVHMTCATPARKRLILDEDDFVSTLKDSSLDVDTINTPYCNGKAFPGLWQLKKAS